MQKNICIFDISGALLFVGGRNHPNHSCHLKFVVENVMAPILNTMKIHGDQWLGSVAVLLCLFTNIIMR